MIVLIGFMGAGKSTVGTAVAARLNRPFVDTDSIIEQREGRSVAEVFEREGEGHFRAVERDVVLSILANADTERDTGQVVALGGGSITSPDVRAVLAGHDVVYLSVGLDEAMRRLSGDATRPLLEGDEIPVLYQYRRSLYEEVASVTIVTDGKSVRECADEIASIVGEQKDGTTIITVAAGARPYDVVVGTGVLPRLGQDLPHDLDPERAFIITHEILRPVADRVASSLKDRNILPVVATIAEGERSKSPATAVGLWEQMTQAGMHRNDLVVGVGGGVVTDLAGFVASTYNRGLAVIQVPTTLLAQVDAAIGGKTGIDLEAGKNLVGTFHQPALVVVDADVLSTLPVEELRSGLAEAIKAGLIADEGLVETIEANAKRIVDGERDVLLEVIVSAVQIKAQVVAADEKESGKRAWLNYGHTFAHSIEAIDRYEGLRHGEAVAVGMMAAAYLSNELGRLSQHEVDRHRDVLTAVGLPVSMSLDLEQLERAWLLDKKHRRGTRFVVLDGIGQPVAGVTAPHEVLEKAIERLAG
ncbi:MAG: 3-dehydroquinate synthase [Actinomycetota bacterium]